MSRGILAAWLFAGLLLPAPAQAAPRPPAAGYRQMRLAEPPALAAPAPAADAPAPDTLATLSAVCADTYQLQHPAACPAVGPGHYAGLIAAAGLPYPLPALQVTAARPFRALTPDAYAKVLTDTAPVYRTPYDALAGLPPLRAFERGFEFVSLVGQVEVDGQTFYQINRGEYMAANLLAPVTPSSFQGVHFAASPAGLTGWVINTVPVSPAPGVAPAADAPYAGRYSPIQPLAVERVGDWNWYLIAPGQWLEQRNLALVPPTPPGGVGGTVIAVDTYEQALGVYQDGRLIFATLVSSGSRYFPTRTGAFQVWAKLDTGQMSGAYFADRRDYYFLEDVPWILYYDGDRALHGAYWHDNFGQRSSHGCVNLSPRDARWLFDFAGVGSTVIIYNSGG
ncbi:MAG: L,D-transpeptidase [Anaerolineales bacterium]|nr:L,D-transpeptidase [Anaerolineales bacterium]